MSDSKICAPAPSSIKIVLPQFLTGEIGWIIAASRELWTDEACEKRAWERDEAFYRRLGY